MPREYQLGSVQLSVAPLLRVLSHLHARPTHHTAVSQVQGIPSEALGQGVGLLTNVVSVGFDWTVRVYHLTWKQSTAEV